MNYHSPVPPYDLDRFWRWWDDELSEDGRQQIREAQDEARMTMGRYLYLHRPDVWKRIVAEEPSA